MILYLMRHGQTDWNLEGRIQGKNDLPLNETGVKQAHKAACNFLELKKAIETVYTSDLKRAKKTAEIISASLDLPMHYTKQLREMDFGKAEGIKGMDLAAKFPYIHQAFNDIKNPERYDIGYPMGETVGQVQKRFMKVVQRLWEDGRENVLIVTHGMLIRIFAEICFKKSIRLDNGSVLRVVFDEKTKRFRSAKVLF
ncbi:MAG: histidine phosphatase family protein [Alphaproteobacteria bacterium]|nr:histidine phosphatase family protein [Alphaproteobacteria bacterium]